MDRLPLSKALRDVMSSEKAWQMALSAGDDYELCFTVPPNRVAELQSALPQDIYTHIGIIEAAPGLRCLDTNGQLFVPENRGYQHHPPAPPPYEGGAGGGCRS